MYQCNIKQFLDPDKDLKDVAEAIKQELTKVPVIVRQHRLFKDWELESKDAVQEDDVEMFDEALHSLYNWADVRRVWLGL